MADHQRAGDTTRKGYGSQHQRLRAALAPEVATGTVACVRCGCLIKAGDPWDLGHRDGTGKREYQGPEHVSCNRRAGALARTSLAVADPPPRPMTRW
jgi:hypothetical protein